jgi:hypothetical protein
VVGFHQDRSVLVALGQGQELLASCIRCL